MHRTSWLALALALGLVAGCASPGPAQDAQPAAPSNVPLGLIETGPAVGPDLEATTAAAPRLVEGEWWRIRFSGGDIYGTEDVLRVVANATDEGYVFGMPHEGWLKEAIIYHVPAFGDVGRDLSYDVHNERFEPVRFPLVQGAAWDTVFAATPMTATVEQADEHTATIRFDPPPSTDPAAPAMALVLPFGEMGTMRLTYDARMHEIVRMESAIGSWEVVEHGFHFRGWVTVPDGAHTAIDYGVFGPDADHPLPMREVDVDPSFNRITVVHGVFGVSPGAYRVTSKAPDGESFVTELVGGTGFKFASFEVSNPGGTWQQEDLAVGVGGTYTMGIAYQQYDILVPDGERRPTHGHDVLR